MNKVGQIQRLIHLITILQSGGDHKASVLAERLEICERHVYRDLNALKAAGIPIFCEGGYKIMDGFFLPPLRFSLSEGIVLLLGCEAFAQDVLVNSLPDI
ncbi:MAG: HTH domain-containing protein [Actinomycetota bacterium]|nr:HTH domain-containing protein [Actinomycetota bacterium]